MSCRSFRISEAWAPGLLFFRSDGNSSSSRFRPHFLRCTISVEETKTVLQILFALFKAAWSALIGGVGAWLIMNRTQRLNRQSTQSHWLRDQRARMCADLLGSIYPFERGPRPRGECFSVATCGSLIAESMQARSDSDRTALAVAAVALLCAVVWIAVNVGRYYGGHISGLFYTGSTSTLPAEISSHTYRVKDSIGFDGQFYHLIAHDPLIRRGFAPFVDNPPLRWRRIAVPGLAAFLAAGDDRAVDSIYVAIQLVFVFLGAFWLSQYAQSVLRRGAWGLAFLLIPGVAVSLDRMTIDLALAALTIGLARYGSCERPAWHIYPVLCAAPLVRETGMVLLGAWCLYSALRRDWWAATLGTGCVVPALAWWTYVHRHTTADGTHWLSRYPFSGILDRRSRASMPHDAVASCRILV